MPIAKTLLAGTLCASLAAGPALSAPKERVAETPPVTAQVLLFNQCPSEQTGARGPAKAFGGILGVIGLSIIKNLAVKAADAFADSMEKRNQALNAVSEYEGFGFFYGPERLTANGEVLPGPADTVTGCIVVARYGAMPSDRKFTAKINDAAATLIDAAVVGPLGRKAGQTGPAHDAGGVATPDFYAEIEVQPAVLPADGTPAAFGYRLKPTLVYFGKSQAKAGADHAKSLRLELTLKRYQLDKGALGDKAIYTGAFDLGRHKPGVLLLPEAVSPEPRLKTEAGPLAAYPAPAELKAGAVRLMSADGRKVASGAAVVDPVPVSAEAKLIEAEDPSALAAAIAKALKDNKTKIQEAATSAALKAVNELVD